MLYYVWRCLACITAVSSGLTIADAGEFKHLQTTHEYGRATFHLEYVGEVKSGDLSRLRLLIETLKTKKADTPEPYLDGEIELLLDSPGGSFEEGIALANFVADNKFKTAVQSGSRCFSACGFIFLAGQQEGPEQTQGRPHRSLHPGGSLGLHAPYLELEDQAYEKAVVEEAYGVAVRHIAKVVGISKKLNLDPDLLPHFLAKTKGEFYLIDTVEKAARFRISVPIQKGGKIRTITPPMAKNYCSYMMARIDRRFVSEESAQYPEIINKPLSFKDDVKAQITKTIHQTRTFKKKIGAPVAETAILIPMYVEYNDGSYLVTICAAEFHFEPERTGPSFSACTITVSGGESTGRGPAYPEVGWIFKESWSQYLRHRTAVERGSDYNLCKQDLVTDQLYTFHESSNVTFSDALFAAPDTPLDQLQSTLLAYQASAPIAPELRSIRAKDKR